MENGLNRGQSAENAGKQFLRRLFNITTEIEN